MKRFLKLWYAEFCRRQRLIPSASPSSCAYGTETIILLALAATTAAVSAYGAYSAAEDQKQVAKANAKAAEADAAIAMQSGEEAARRQRRKDRMRLESFASRSAAMGVVPREGSSLLAELDFAEQAELEAQHVKHGYTLDARQKRVQGSFAKWQADRISPSAAAGTSLLNSAGSIAGSYATGGTGTAAGSATQQPRQPSYSDGRVFEAP